MVYQGIIIAVFSISAIGTDEVSAPVRLLVLLHDTGGMAHNDATAAENNFSDHVSGRYSIRGQWGPGELADRLLIRMKQQAIPGDTLIIHTIGHGLRNGRMVGYGTRRDFLTELETAADKLKQKVIWWQLSCFACAELPQPKSEYVSIVSSSPATATSSTHTQALMMKHVVEALRDRSLDANKDGAITIHELQTFLNAQDDLRRGDLVWGPAERVVLVLRKE